MTRPIIAIQDVSTGAVEQREMNDEEYAQWLLDAESAKATAEAEAAEALAKAEAKASALAKLTALGLTEDEAKAIAE